MAKIAKSLTDLIGHTPLLETKNYNKEFAKEATILTKLEYFNPAGSAKDRIAFAMVVDAEKTGIKRPAGTYLQIPFPVIRRIIHGNILKEIIP